MLKFLTNMLQVHSHMSSRIFLFICTVLHAQVFATAAPFRLAVPFGADKLTIASTMGIELDAEDLGGLPLAELTKAGLHPSIAALQMLFGHLSARRVHEAAAMMKPDAILSPGDAQSYAAAFGAPFRTALPSVIARRRYTMGSESWVSFEMTLEETPYNRVFRFTHQNGQWYWADELRPSSLRSIQTLTSAAEQLVADKLIKPGNLDGRDFRYSVPVPGLPVRWLFNGFSTSWDAFGDGPVPDHPVTLVYSAAVKALYQGDIDIFASYHLPFSAQRIRESVDRMDSAQKAMFADSIRQQGRLVTFVLDASPIFLVFYESESTGLQYDTLYAQDGKLEKLRFCNFFMSHFIDDILLNEVIFHNPVVRPLAGRLDDPPPALETSAILESKESKGSLVRPVTSALPQGSVHRLWRGRPRLSWALVILLALLLYLFYRITRSKL